LDIDEISGEKQSFTVNVFVRLRWKDERLAHIGKSAEIIPLTDVWEGYLLVVGQQALFRRAMPEDVDVEPDGTVIYRQQWSGPLSQPLSLANFPLDKQDFNIHFVATGYRANEIEFVPDVIPGAEDLVGGGLAKELSLPDWKVLSVKPEARPFKLEKGLEVPGFALTFVAKRHFAYYLWNIMLPMWLIVMMSWAPFWVDPHRAEVQMGVASSSVLTLIAYRFVIANLLPKLPYLTRIDYMALGITILVFAAFIQVITTSILAYKNHYKLALRLDHICRVFYPVVFIIIQALALFIKR
jgi:hypothetical protein